MFARARVCACVCVCVCVRPARSKLAIRLSNDDDQPLLTQQPQLKQKAAASSLPALPPPTHTPFLTTLLVGFSQPQERGGWGGWKGEGGRESHPVGHTGIQPIQAGKHNKCITAHVMVLLRSNNFRRGLEEGNIVLTVLHILHTSIVVVELGVRNEFFLGVVEGFGLELSLLYIKQCVFYIA